MTIFYLLESWLQKPIGAEAGGVESRNPATFVASGLETAAPTLKPRPDSDSSDNSEFKTHITCQNLKKNDHFLSTRKLDTKTAIGGEAGGAESGHFRGFWPRKRCS